MAAFFVLFVIINWLCWLCWAFVVGYLGKDREIGMGTAVAWSLLLSPLIGLIIALSSPRGDRRARGTPTEARKLFAQGEKKVKRRDYDASARNGYSSRSIGATAGEDVFTTLSRLGKLKANELMTEEEFAAQKKKLLGS